MDKQEKPIACFIPASLEDLPPAPYEDIAWMVFGFIRGWLSRKDRLKFLKLYVNDPALRAHVRETREMDRALRELYRSGKDGAGRGS